ncbi:MAG: hypothetical protein KF753_04660 [Caldilineaceae bacterium]|nr:hypothetical protein [Caldilineaceae bacterium]
MAWFRTIIVGFLCPIVASVVIFFPSTSVESAFGANEEIAIFPTTPTFSQSFFVTVSGQWVNSCVPRLDSFAVDGTSLRLTARTPGPTIICQEKLTDWGLSVRVPAQEPNFYWVDMKIISGVTGQTLSVARREFEIVGGLQIIPALPLATEDVTLRLAGLNPDGCVPYYVSHQLQGQTVMVEAQIPDGVCGQVPTPWQMEASIDPHPAGAYQAELYITDHRYIPPQRTRFLAGSFVIAERILTYYFPLWGCFGPDIAPKGCTAIEPASQQGVVP